MKLRLPIKLLRKLPTDEETNKLFDSVMARLVEDCDCSESEANALIHEYYHNFRDEEYCRKINIPVQDDDFFFHEAAGGMALRIYYYLVLKGNPDPQNFLEWRSRPNKKNLEY